MAISRAIVYHPLRFDLKNLLATFGSRAFRSSPQSAAKVEEFEFVFAEYVGSRHAVAFPFARTALYFALKNQRFEVGSEVIMPPITIKPMMDVVVALGLRPVFVDIERDTLCFDLEELENAINQNTKAILITYLYGVVPNVKRLISLCREHGLFVIEDFSHNLNARSPVGSLGTLGDVGIYSCSATKTLDAYGGGLTVTDDEALFSALKEAQAALRPTPAKRLRAKVLKDVVWNVATQKWLFSIVIFPLLRILRKVNPTLEQRLTGARLGLKPAGELPEEYFERFTKLQAEAGLTMLRRVDEEDAGRILNVEEIKRSLPEHARPWPQLLDGCRNVYWQFVVYLPDGEKAKKSLARRGVDAGTSNLSLISGLGIYTEYERSCPNAEYIKNHAFLIPAYRRLSRRDLRNVKRALREVIFENSGLPLPGQA